MKGIIHHLVSVTAVAVSLELTRGAARLRRAVVTPTRTRICWVL
jgi:hypothetical protein